MSGRSTGLRVAAIAVGISMLAACASSTDGTAASGSTAAGSNSANVKLRVGDLNKQMQTFWECAHSAISPAYDLEWNQFQSGPAAFQAMQAKAIDVTFTADIPTVFALSSGLDVHVVAAGPPPSGSAVAILVPKGSSIRDVSELAGKKVGVTTGTIMQFVTYSALDKVGAKYDSITPVNLPAPGLFSAFQAGQIDAAALPDPFRALAEQGGARVIGGSDTTYDGYIVATGAALQDRSTTAAIGAFLKDAVKVVDWDLSHPTEWASCYAKAFQVSDSVASVAAPRLLFKFGPPSQAVGRANAEAKAFTDLNILKGAFPGASAYSDQFFSVQPSG